MNLNNILEEKRVKKFRELILSQDETDIICTLIQERKDIRWFIPFLKVSANLPKKLLEPILQSGIKISDPSFPKYWMPDLIRMYTPNCIDTCLFELIQHSSLPDKCRLTSLFYWNQNNRCVPLQYEGLEEVLEQTWKWDGQTYIQEYQKVSVKERQHREKSLKNKRYQFLLGEFKKHNNLVYQYYIALELPKSVGAYSDLPKESYLRVINNIKQDDFPDSASLLIQRIQGNPELEKLLFQELTWQG